MKLDHELIYFLNRSITKASDLVEEIEECLQELISKVTEREAIGSGWSLSKVDSISIRIHKHGYGRRGSSYITLSKKLQTLTAVLMLKTKITNVSDMQCWQSL